MKIHGKLSFLPVLSCVFLLMTGIVFGQTRTAFAASSPEYLQKVENAVLSTKTKKIQYCYGKIKEKKNRCWKKAEKLSRTAGTLTIRKKGWCTFRITLTSGKYKLFRMKLKKKTYTIRANTPLKQKSGYYRLIPKCNEAGVLEVQDSDLAAGKRIVVGSKGNRASQVWSLELAGGTKLRLKNVNSGLYLGTDKPTGNTPVLQKRSDKKDSNQIFQCVFAGGSYLYVKDRGTKEYLYISKNQVMGAGRKKNKAWKFRLEPAEPPQSQVTVSNTATYPTTMTKGTSFRIKGVLESPYSITSLTASVISADGVSVLSKTVTPNCCTYDLAGVDSALTFGQLPVGSYHYKVVLTDAAGHTLTAFDKVFQVTMPSAVSGYRLVYNQALIAAVGYQKDGNALEKKACASYALAYCNAILTGQAVSPHTYWVSESNVDCDWSKGGFTTTAYNSEQEVLQAAYTRLVAGQPSILHVYSSTSSQHWLAVIGYQNVTNAAALTPGNLLAIDPWDGAVITVSDRYRVKNTYRLGYKAGT